MTVAQSVFSRVRAEFNLGQKRISKSEILEWTITYVEKGEQKTANKDTVGRKLRLLVEGNYLGAEYDAQGQAWIVPATGERKPIKEEQEPEDEAVAPVDSFRGVIRWNGIAHIFTNKTSFDAFRGAHEDAIVIN